jgi:hypothetical protein
VKDLKDNGVECSKMGKQMSITLSKVVGRPSAVSDDLFGGVLKKSGRGHFIISELASGFPQISRTVLYKISYARLSQVLCKMGSKNAHRCAQNAEHSSALTFFSITTKMATNFSITSYE